MNNFIFGTQYLRGASPRPEYWEKDLKQISAAGFNTIRVWLVWGVLEVREGEIDFSYIEKILSLAEKENLRVIFLFHLHGAPEWLSRKYPQYRYVNRNGHAFEPSARTNTPSGGWPGLCPDHKIVQELEERFIREVTSYIGDRAFAYEPINEPHQWVDSVLPMEYCYCEATKEQFRIWLKKKYKTLDALGSAWGRYFDCWENVTPSAWDFGYNDRLDFRRFTTEQIALLVRRRAEVIRKYTTRPVIAHAWGGGSTCCPQLAAMAFDDWRNAAEVDLWGCSGFPDKVEQTAQLAQSMVATRSAANGKTFWQSELGVGNLGSGLEFNPPASPELLATWCFDACFHGAKGVLFWQFRQELFGHESAHYGMVNRDGSSTPRLETLSRVAGCFKQHEKDFMPAQIPAAQAALLFSFDSNVLNALIQDSNKFCLQALSGYYSAFFGANIPVDILHCDRLSAEKLQQYKLIVAPGIILLSREIGKMLEEYVQNGGRLLLDPLTGSWDENGTLSDSLPGGGLAGTIGVSNEELNEEKSGFLEVCFEQKTYLIPRKYTFAQWQSSPENVPVICDAAGTCYLRSRTVGKGEFLLSSIALGNLNSSGETIGDDFRSRNENSATGNTSSLIQAVYERCGIVSEFQSSPQIHCSTLNLPDGGKLLLVSNLSNAPATAQIRSEAWRGAVCQGIYGTQDICFSPDGKADIPLAPCASCVLKKQA
jgi:beta-galactosidase GanA